MRFPFAPGRRYTPPDAPKEQLFLLHDTLGIERAVIVQPNCHGKDHRAVAEAIAARPGRIRGVALVDDRTTDAELGALNVAGFRAARFHLVSHHPAGSAAPLEKIRHTAERVHSLGWHMVFQVDAQRLVDLSDLWRSFACTVIIDHMARIDPARGLAQPVIDALFALLDRGNFYVKLSCHERLSAKGYPYGDSVALARHLLTRAPERVLWGTDWPHANFEDTMPQDADLVDLIQEIARTDVERQKLLVVNPARLYDFE